MYDGENRIYRHLGPNTVCAVVQMDRENGTFNMNYERRLLAPITGMPSWFLTACGQARRTYYVKDEP